MVPCPVGPWVMSPTFPPATAPLDVQLDNMLLDCYVDDEWEKNCSLSILWPFYYIAHKLHPKLYYSITVGYI